MNARLFIGLSLFACLARLTAAPAKLEKTLILPPRPPEPGTTFGILLTGDGGWAELVRRVGAGMTNAGIPIVGWNSRAYYWTRRTPTEAANDLAGLIERFQKEWHRPRVVLIGYSMGADVLPFLVTRLPQAQRQSIDLIALLGPGHVVDFEFHVRSYFGESGSKSALAVPNEINKLKGLPLLVLYAEHDKESCGAMLPRDVGEVRALPGNHHFGGDYDRLVRAILDSLAKQRGKTHPAAPAPARGP